MGARTVDKKHVRMICTVGTSLGCSGEQDKNLLQESEQGRDSRLDEWMRKRAAEEDAKQKEINPNSPRSSVDRKSVV